MSRPTFGFWLAGQKRRSGTTLEVVHKFSGVPAAQVALADSAVMDEAIDAAHRAAPAMRRLPAFERRRILTAIAEGANARATELAHWLCVEVGKTIRDAETEVGRLVDTFRIAADETAASRGGEVLPLDGTLRGQNTTGFTRRVPRGPVGLITPFNFPLNLAAHKVAPAIAAGCPWILKPASTTPVTSLVLGEIIAAAGLPPGAFSILPCSRDTAERLATDPRIRLLSFTGSPDVGWSLKSRSGKKPVILELGGNAAVLVDKATPLEPTVERVVAGAFSQAGQSCISVQRIFVHEEIHHAFRESLLNRTKALVLGDPEDRRTDVGPLISEAEAERVVRWVKNAQIAGASVLCGGTRHGAMVEPTLLENVPDQEPIVCREVFGPVAVIDTFKCFDQVLEKVNSSEFGLQAGVFTTRLDHVWKAWETLEVGGVVIGDVPTFRSDDMPYGGVKDSGQGREGVRSAILEMCEPRLLVIRGLGL